MVAEVGDDGDREDGGVGGVGGLEGGQGGRVRGAGGVDVRSGVYVDEGYCVSSNSGPT